MTEERAESLDLNPPQAEAVAHGAGPLLVFAGAGSGKTRVITYRIAHLVLEHRVPAYRILAVTFTNKAAGELKQRLAKLLGEGMAGELWVGTFHSICARLLRRHHDAVGLGRKFSIYDDGDQKAVVARVQKQLGYDDRQFPPKQVLSRIHALKQEDVSPAEAKAKDRIDSAVAEIYAGYENALRAANAVDFDDLLLHMLHIVEDPSSLPGRELRERFRHVLVDEFQDTSLVQYRLVRALAAEGRNLCVVGDDDQSIYSWRGADVRLILGFKHDFPDATVVKLEQNYRSTGNVVKAALGVIEPARSREPKKLWTQAEAGEPVRIRFVSDERDEAAWVVRTVQAERARDVPADQVAIFYRIHAQSRVLEEALRSAKIPYKIIGGMRFFERAEVKDVIAYLRLLDNPRSDADLLRIINVPPRGIGDKTVDALLDHASRRGTCAWDALHAAVASAELGAAAKKKLQAFHDMMEELRVAAAELSPATLADKVIDHSGYRAALEKANSAEADARLENLAEFVGSISEYEEEIEAGDEEPTLEGYLERIALVAAVDALDGEASVPLMTVHSAKGLEFETVILTGMEEEMFPYEGMDGSTEEDIDEERRLAYVAITRARRRLYVSHASERTIFGRTRWCERSRFLDDLPLDVIEHVGGGARPGSAARGGAGRGDLGFASAPRGFARSSGFMGARSHASASASTTLSSARPAKPPLRPGERAVDYDVDAAPPDEDGVSLRRGDSVRHERYGRGTVESVSLGADPSVVANFPAYGTKKVLVRYLRPG